MRTTPLFSLRIRELLCGRYQVSFIWFFFLFADGVQAGIFGLAFEARRGRQVIRLPQYLFLIRDLLAHTLTLPHSPCTMDEHRLIAVG